MNPSRLETFADGVFAIAATLLILNVDAQIGEHSSALGHRLLEIWPSYIAYAVSFVTIGIMWVNHHLVFRQFARVDGPLLLLNVLLLMLIAFVPFPTRVVAEFARSDADRRDAALLYGLTMTITAICFFALWFYGSRHVLHPHADPRVVSGITRSYLPGVPIYGLVTVLAFVNATASLILFGLIAAFYALAAALFSRTPAMAEATAASGDSPL